MAAKTRGERKKMSRTLIKVCEWRGESGEDYLIFHRDSCGRLYQTDNAHTCARLTGKEWSLWTAQEQRAAITWLEQILGRQFAVVVASQSGGRQALTAEERRAAAEWNRRFRAKRYRLFRFAECCVERGKVIDLPCAIGRGLVETNGRGVSRISDDLIDLGNHTEAGHKRKYGEAVADYFDMQ
jgi:hypothetical protein